MDTRGRLSFDSRDYAFCGVLGALALVMPFFFHLLHLGPVFLPMFIPLVALAFFVGPYPAVLTALVVPILSACLTGMPAFYPPLAPIKSIEMAVMAALISLGRERFPAARPLAILLPALLAGRAVNAGLCFLAARWLELPPAFAAGLSFFAGWPGILLMLAVIPPVVRLARK